MGKYLHIHQSELRDNEIDMEAKLEQSILCGSTIRFNSIIERYMRICSRTVRK